MDALIPPLLRKNKQLLCILVERDLLTLVLFFIESKRVTLTQSMQVLSQEFRCSKEVLHLPLLGTTINSFIKNHKTNALFAIIIQPKIFLPHQAIFEYQLLAYFLSLHLTHVLSAQHARLQGQGESTIKNSDLDQETFLAVAGGVRIFMEEV